VARLLPLRAGRAQLGAHRRQPLERLVALCLGRRGARHLSLHGVGGLLAHRLESRPALLHLRVRRREEAAHVVQLAHRGAQQPQQREGQPVLVHPAAAAAAAAARKRAPRDAVGRLGCGRLREPHQHAAVARAGPHLRRPRCAQPSEGRRAEAAADVPRPLGQLAGRAAARALPQHDAAVARGAPQLPAAPHHQHRHERVPLRAARLAPQTRAQPHVAIEDEHAVGACRAAHEAAV